ncbi:MAG: bifunctional 2-C-methyl-D-erythritol 4-phosphate cytidylyltransferase/2-C-methyl-D-erythritol 2,4-cyclodiphosphate synthase [Rhodospirillales bacterium]|nr:bifunctional 2-C-methyl-D-erythritol 4-phosphate cytidylyltransferase/2-C-methyl-D-erythritol 2,4-cyclodiphosphate synthase [Rhodospirillales bacterium]MDH3910923.1 bifunctional 2-C-methyl-D-erythritol 4-phosphate cytidylyltransferase/2-C-methyl-D-erythritol 2,4-cyclodiphosphate synthase [Rhodospirillales bacterium]MDH3969293.1 bifunctional 2-C-methyl-D-erythritol 4-phosphate cytidylyltransferase/2-C-methyl-D-erythritol 2,4-cyclodiphosphate synthase [Rhodospirillales bacterium]
MERAVALVVAAGRGERFGGARPKQYETLAGRPLLHHGLAALVGHPAIAGVRAVIHPDDLALYQSAAEGLDLLDPVPGGANRQDSARLGLESLEELAPEHVLIHDGARPLLPAEVIDRVLRALDRVPGAVAALPVTDTLKREHDGLVAETVARQGLWRAQTPQGFHYPAILAAHRAAAGAELTDDAAVAEQAGLPVALVEGSPRNLKVTTPEDLARAETILTGGGGAQETRSASGFDVHRFGPGDHVTLCGVKIPHDRALLGHSDADVALHALTDALLGALGAGDIGLHFPPTDPRWRGADSAVFLRNASERVAARGGRIVNVDVTVICEAPKLAPHRAHMVARLAELLDLAPERVNVKATTTEGLGFTGRGEGIAAQASATLCLPRRG